MPNDVQAEESRRIAAASAGDRLSLDRLLLRHRDRLHRYIERHLASGLQRHIGTEDVLQEALTDACRYICNFEGQHEEDFFRWLTTIAKRRCIDAIRRAQALRHGGQEQINRLATTMVGVVADSRRSPSQSAANREAVELMKEAIAGLNSGYRDVLQWRYVDGLSSAVIASKLQRTEHAVHMLCNRAIRSLRTVLQSRSNLF